MMELQWPLMVFTLFVCLGAGTFGMAGFMAAMGKGAGLQVPSLIVAAASLVIAGIGSFLHLQHWERIFNGFGHLTSGITQELIAIVVFFAGLAIYALMLRRLDGGPAPRWCAGLAIVVSAILVVVMSHSYNMAARPAWDTPLLWLYYLGNAAVMGALSVACIAGVKDEAALPVAVKTALGALIVLAVTILVYALFFAVAGSAFSSVGFYFDPTHPTKPMVDPVETFNLFGSGMVMLFWMGAFVMGALVPLVLMVLARGKQPGQVRVYAGIGLACAVVGGLAFRAALYLLGFSVFVFY